MVKRFIPAVVLACAAVVLAGGAHTAQADPPPCPPELEHTLWGCQGGPPDPWEWE